MPQPYKLFTIYAREDAQYLSELLGQLRPLELAGRIKVWSDREIDPGVEWEKEIVQKLDTADIILILVSSAYYNSVYIHEVEIKYALSRHDKGEARVLPVIVRPCHFGDDPIISRLHMLPTDGKPVTDRRHWPERDDAWLDVVAGVKRTIDALRHAELEREKAAHQAAERQRLAALAAEQEAERARHKEAQARLEEEARTRREEQRREQELAARRADLNAWQHAAYMDTTGAYETYLTRYSQGGYAREAHARIKQLKREVAKPLPIERYAAIGGGGLALLLAIWLLPNLFGGKKEEQSAQNQLTQPDTARATPPVTLTFNYPMKQVTGGSFTMGSPANEAGRLGTECQHTVTVGSFNMGQYEVTQAQWKAIMGKNPSYFKDCDDCPVENVSWNEIQEFIKTLNWRVTTGGKKYRLPTEAEWEYAARGGNRSKGYQQYAGSNTLGSVAWYDANAGNKTHPVGGKSPNELGLFDMSGNVWEWCQDVYKACPCDNEAREGVHRVNRGGGWHFSSRYCRAASRDDREPGYRDSHLGFRLVSLPLE